MYRKILVPLDGSELAKEALGHAEELAKTYAAEIILFQVIPIRCFFAPPELVKPFIVDEKEMEAAQMNLTKLAKEMGIRGHKVTAKVITGRNVAMEIIDFAKKNRVDLVVMCKHGCSGTAKLALGRVAHGVLTRTEIPILLIYSNE